MHYLEIDVHVQNLYRPIALHFHYHFTSLQLRKSCTCDESKFLTSPLSAAGCFNPPLGLEMPFRAANNQAELSQPPVSGNQLRLELYLQKTTHPMTLCRVLLFWAIRTKHQLVWWQQPADPAVFPSADFPSIVTPANQRLAFPWEQPIRHEVPPVEGSVSFPSFLFPSPPLSFSRRLHRLSGGSAWGYRQSQPELKHIGVTCLSP